MLQRSAPWSPPLSFVSLKFELAFNLAVIWMIVFVALGKGIKKYIILKLSKWNTYTRSCQSAVGDQTLGLKFDFQSQRMKPLGLRSYGKVVYAFGTLPILGYFIICVKVLGYSSSVPTSGVGGVLDRTPWNEFFTDTKVRLVHMFCFLFCLRLHT